MGDQSTLQAIADAPFPLTEVDKWVLSQSDEDYKLHDWDDLKHIIGVWIHALLGFILSIKRWRWHCSFTLTRAEKTQINLKF